MESVIPFQGTTLVSLSADCDEIEAKLGAPLSVRKSRQKELREYSGERRVTYSSEGRAIELGFSPPGRLVFEGHNLLEGDDPVATLMAYDENPMRLFQFVVFLKIGIAIAGFHTGVESEKSIFVFAEGHWDKYVPDMTPFRADDQKA